MTDIALHLVPVVLGSLFVGAIWTARIKEHRRKKAMAARLNLAMQRQQRGESRW